MLAVGLRVPGTTIALSGSFRGVFGGIGGGRGQGRLRRKGGWEGGEVLLVVSVGEVGNLVFLGGFTLLVESEGRGIFVRVFNPLVVEREGLYWAGREDVLFMERSLDFRLTPISFDASWPDFIGRCSLWWQWRRAARGGSLMGRGSSFLGGFQYLMIVESVQ